MKKLAILGSTGSIGRQTLNVVETLSDQLKITALAAGNNLDELVPQILRHHPELVSVADEKLADDLARRLRELHLEPLRPSITAAKACWPSARMAIPTWSFPLPSAW